MTVLFREFNEYVKKCTKIMKIIGIDVIDEDFKYSYILMSYIVIVVVGFIIACYSFFEAINGKDFERMLKVLFVLGITIQVVT
jgi:hypothetical protein